MTTTQLRNTNWETKVALCFSCGISSICGNKITPRYLLKGDYNLILFVGSAPNEEDNIAGSPISNRLGDELDIIIAQSIPNNFNICITNAVFCTPFKDSDLDAIRPPSLSEVNECREHIRALIQRLQPRLIIALGKIAARSLKPICDFTEVVHPSSIFASTHPDLERTRAILSIQEAIKDISK